MHYVLRSANLLLLLGIVRNVTALEGIFLYTYVTSNYRGISVLQTVYKMLSNILVSRLTPYVGANTGDH